MDGGTDATTGDADLGDVDSATVSRDRSDDVTDVVLPGELGSLVTSGAIGEAAGILWYREAGEIVYPAGAATRPATTWSGCW